MKESVSLAARLNQRANGSWHLWFPGRHDFGHPLAALLVFADGSRRQWVRSMAWKQRKPLNSRLFDHRFSKNCFEPVDIRFLVMMLSRGDCQATRRIFEVWCSTASRGLSMNLKPWAATIQQIVDELNSDSKGRMTVKVLMAWRRKLGKEPTSLPPYQIDEIIREVRNRITGVSRLRSARGTKKAACRWAA